MASTTYLKEQIQTLLVSFVPHSCAVYSQLADTQNDAQWLVWGLSAIGSIEDMVALELYLDLYGKCSTIEKLDEIMDAIEKAFASFFYNDSSMTFSIYKQSNRQVIEEDIKDYKHISESFDIRFFGCD